MAAEEKKGMVSEFKEFIMRGNVMDMAVGVIIGGAFQAIIKSLVDDVIMPVIGVATGGMDFSNLFIALTEDAKQYASYAEAKEAGAAVLGYGAFITAIINFILMAIVIFLVVKGINQMHKKEEAPANTKVCPYCKSEIDKEATKCPHCTSALEA